MKKYTIIFIGAVLGLVTGFLYWKYVGCLDGTCALKSNPWTTTLYGAFSGGVIGSIVTDFLRKKASTKD